MTQKRVNERSAIEPIATSSVKSVTPSKLSSAEDSSPSIIRLEQVQIDTSPTCSAKPDIREVTAVVGSPNRLRANSVASHVVTATASGVRRPPPPPQPLVIKPFSTPPPTRALSKSSRSAPIAVNGVKSADPRSKLQPHGKKSTPTFGQGRVRAVSESKVSTKQRTPEDDIVVAQEVMKHYI